MTKSVYIIKNITAEGPGTIGEYLAKAGIPFRTIDLSAGESLPAGLDQVGAVVALGGPMNVDEESRYPHLKAEDQFIKAILAAGIPYFGVCLGAQLLAKAAGAKVYPAGLKEIGWSTVELTAAAADDPLFTGLGNDLEVFQWHGDTFDLPAGAVLLAQGSQVKHQAFRVGRAAYGLQFHIEVNEAIIGEWFKGDRGREEYLAHFAAIKDNYSARAEKIFQRFFDLSIK